MTAPTIGGLNPITYSEGAAPVNIGAGATFTGGLGYPGGSITFDLSNPDANDVLALTSAADGTVSGAISVDPDGKVYLGNGTGRDLIGNVDPIDNGQDGHQLTINFIGTSTGVFSDSSFESDDPTTGWASEWTVVEGRVILGTDLIAGWLSPADTTHPAGNNGTVSPGDSGPMTDPLTFDVGVASGAGESSDGSRGLRLFSGDATGDSGSANSEPYGVIHGPYVYSDPFGAQAGDILRFDWKAQGGDDAFDAFGYLLNKNTGQAIVCLDQSGTGTGSTTDWDTVSVTVPSDGEWQFVFVSGAFDYSGGQKTGGSLYIDNFTVERSKVTDEVLQTIANQVTYENTGDAPIEDRSLAVGVTDGTGSAQQANTGLDVTNVDDAPTGGVTVAGTAEQGAVLTASNTIADPDGPDPLTIAYQWQREDGPGNWVNIGGANGVTYTLTQDDVGHAVRAVASYTDAGGQATSLNSNQTTAVANDDPAGTVTATGTPTQGAVVTASNNITDIDGPDPLTIAYQWQREDGAGNWVNIGGATGTSYQLTQDDVGHAVRTVASYTDANGESEQVVSNQLAAVANVNDDPTGGVSVAGVATQGEVLTASNTIGDLDGVDPADITYQWQREDGAGNWVDIGGATDPTYTLTQDDVGHAVRAVAQYTDDQGTAEEVRSAPTTAVTNVDDDPTGGVSVAGVATQGEVLTASNTIGDLDGVDPADITYQWQREDGAGNWVDIGGATDPTYTLTQDDVGHAVRAVAHYTDDQGAAEEVPSAPTTAVGNVDDDPTGGVSVAGVATQGEVLTASNTIGDLDGVDPADITYQWQREDGAGNWVDIGGATDPTYILAQDDVGHAIRAVAHYTDDQGAAEEVPSAPTTAVANIDDTPSGGVTVSGTAEQGAVLTASNDLTDPDGPDPLTITYQWQREDGVGNWVNIGGATGTSYELTQDDVGHAVRVVASYTDAGGQPESFDSNETTAVANVDDDPTGAVSVAGDPTQGEVLTASNTIDDLDGVDPADITYQWQREDGAGNWVDIGGATDPTYTLTQDDVGHAVRAVAHYADDQGAAEEVPSAPTTAVANVNDAPVAGDDSFNVPEDTATALDVLANDADIDGDTRQITHVNGVAIAAGIAVEVEGGSVTLDPDGKLLFTPDVEFNGPVSFDYTIADGHGETATGSVELNVTAVNDAPVPADDSFTATADGSSITLDVLANDVDADNDIPRIAQIDGRAIAPGGSLEVIGGLVTLNADGDLVFTASMTFDGTAHFTYTVDDGHGGMATGAVSGEVTAVAAWGDAGDQLDDILGEHGTTQPNYVNNLLYIASVVSPGAFDRADGSDGTGAGYHMGLGYDLTPSAATPDMDLLSRSLAALIEAQESSNAPDLLAGDDSSGWNSAVDQSLLFQSKLATGGVVGIDYTSGDAQFSDLASQGWSRQFAQMVLRADFSESMIGQLDGRAQGQLHQVTVGQGAELSVNIGGQAAGAPQVALSNGFGMADFVTADGNSAVEVARAVAVAATVDASDDQSAVVRMRQSGTLDLKLQFYKVDDFTGAIDGLRPGDAGYAAAASAHAYQTSSGSTWLSGGGFGKYSEGVLVGIDHDDLIAMRLSNGTQEFFAFAQANETMNGQHVGHLWSYGMNTWGWEDLAGGGDRDFNDLIVQLDFTSAHLDQVI